MNDAPERAEATVWRVRLATGVLVLAALMFRQAPGLIAPDTKLDLTANPAGFLTRALHIWDPQGALGQLQNQAYGYLFPVGPVHLLLIEAGVTPWVVQRIWWTLLAGVAFLGFWKLSGALAIGTPWTRYVGAFLFALNPRLLSEVAVTSVEVWPLALAPWILYPLVCGGPRSWTWRISRSALAVLCLGGVNAVASGAALILPVLWFATRDRPRRVILPALAWLGAVTAVCLWWMVPLVLLGRYSPPFLDWIEDSQVTTGLASAYNALNGTTAWLNFLSTSSGPSWPAGWLLVTTPALILATALVAGFGLAGLAHRGMPERRFLLVAAWVGLLLLTAGYAGAGASPLAEIVRSALDGPLAPFRNTHKFDLVLRLPLMLGAVHALTTLRSRSRTGRQPGWLGPVLASCLVVAVAAPAVAAVLPREGAYERIPSYWREAARWLDDQPGDGSVLVEPAASFADLTWGSPKDEPLQPLMRRPFVVRDAVPLGSAGATRALDEIERRLGAGRGSAGLAEMIGSLGVRYVLVRNDLAVAAQGSPPMAVHQALAQSGLSITKAFGPTVQSPVDSPTLTVNERTLLPYRSVEVFEVPSLGARFVPASRLFSATAGPEDLPELLAEWGSEDVGLLGSDLTAAPDLVASRRHILTDGIRRRETFFGAPTDNTSQTLTASDPGRQHRRAMGYVSDPQANQSVLDWAGVAAVTSSSSASDAGATLRLGPGTSPAAAVDGDPTTRWVSGRYLSAVGEWLELDFGEPRSLEGLHIRFNADPPVTRRPSQVAIETDTGTGSAVVKGTGEPEAVIAPPGDTQRLRIRLTAVSGDGPPNGFAISEVELPGLTPRAVVAAPARQWGEGQGAVILRVENPGRSGCLHQGERPLCTSRFQAPVEEPTGLTRAFDTSTPGTYDVKATVVPREGDALDRLLVVGDSITASSSSREVSAPEGRPGAAVDRDLGTGWVAAASDATPRLTLDLPRPRVLSGLQLLNDSYLAASRPLRVRVSLDGRAPLDEVVGADGYVRFRPQTAKRVTIDFVKDDPLVNIDAVTGYRTQRPVGVSEVRVLGADEYRRALSPDRAVIVPCGFGPTIVVGGRSILTEVRASVRQVMSGTPVAVSACGPDGDVVTLPAGHHLTDIRATAEFCPQTLVLSDPLAVAGAGEVTTLHTLARSSPARSDVELPSRADSGIVVLPHNFNAGWTATDGSGNRLQPVRVNGWQQGWRVAEGGATVVHARFAADAWYARGLASGPVVAALLALLLALTGTRRGRVRGRGPSGPRAVGGRLLTGAATLAVASVAFGWTGVVAWTAAAILALVVPRGTQRWVGPTAAAVCMTAAGALVAASPWTHGAAATDSYAVQALVVGGLAIATLSSVGTSSRELAVRTSNRRL